MNPTVWGQDDVGSQGLTCGVEGAVDGRHAQVGARIVQAGVGQ